MNKLFLAIGIMAIMTVSVSAHRIIFAVPTDGDSEGGDKMMFGGDSGITVLAAGADSDGKAAADQPADGTKTKSFGADTEVKVMAPDGEGKATFGEESNKALSVAADDPDDDTGEKAAAGIDDGGMKFIDTW